jgi:hypothetical protein
MKRRRFGKQVTRRLLTTLIGAAGCFSMAVPPALSEEGPPVSSPQSGSAPSVPEPPPGKATAAPEVGSGMTIYIDPQTGEIRPDPAPGTVPLQLTPEQRNAFSTSHEGLVEVPSTEPGGGVKLDLQGRFQSPLVGTIDADGKVRTQHIGEPPVSGSSK